jgi:hypothetical protein
MAAKRLSGVHEFRILNLDSNKRMILGVIVPLANFIFAFLVTYISKTKPVLEDKK